MRNPIKKIQYNVSAICIWDFLILRKTKKAVKSEKIIKTTRKLSDIDYIPFTRNHWMIKIDKNMWTIYCMERYILR